MRRTGRIKPKPRAEDDKVTPELVEYLARRDGGCVAPLVDPRLDTLCTDKWGTVMARTDPRCWTIEHVHEGYGKMGDRAKSDPLHTVILCSGHGVQSWELSHKDDLRGWIAKKEAGR